MSTCFVVQGFGKKTDFTDGRVLDLDASYAVIKEAVQDAGLVCIRADEIQHSGTIDLPMYQQLLEADLVIADLSTYNVNAVFELGIRYALRPHATIIVAEDGFNNPFDVGKIVIRRYRHLGEDIGRQEAIRFATELTDAIKQILDTPSTDSPVYTFLPELMPPSIQGQQNIGAEALDLKATGRFSVDALHDDAAVPGIEIDAEVESARPEPTASELRESAQLKMRESDFTAACRLWEKVREQRPNDNYVLQQLVLAKYKSQQPTPEEALNNAKKLLQNLSPQNTNDPETLGLWGAIHKRLWDINKQQADLQSSISAYERGFYVKRDYYNGINLAFLLDQRALSVLKAGNSDEAIADRVLAKRARHDVIQLARPILTVDLQGDKRYWVLATLWEASVALGDTVDAGQWEAQARDVASAKWMIETTEKQITEIKVIQNEFSALL